MADALKFKTRMNFEYDVAREMAPQSATSIQRIVANNPSPWTFKGTNTYILGNTDVAVIDPGPDDAGHCAAVLAAVGKRRVSHIILTHTHHDHYDGLARLQQKTKAIVCGYGRAAPAGGKVRRPSDGSEHSDDGFAPDIVLGDNDVLEGADWQLTALFTPGHAPDHLCLALDGTGITFSGDHVMAWNTSVVAPPEGRMADYLASLERLTSRKDTLYLPGHGGKLREPQRMVRGYLWHRRWREGAIHDAIKEGHGTINEIVSLVYPGLDPRLVKAASLSVQAHVQHLMERNLVTCPGPLTWDQRLSA